MRAGVLGLSIMLAVTVLSLLSSWQATVVGQNTATQVQKAALSEKNDLKNLRVDESTNEATGILPDLTIKEMCLDVDSEKPAGPDEVLRVLVANIGNKDSDSFELGLEFMYEDGSIVSGRWYVDKLAGFKAGEQRWRAYSPTCCGFSPIEHVVKKTVRFQVIADPSYYETYGLYDPRTYQVKSKITESNKRNNTLTISRAAMTRCDLKKIEKQTPRIQMKPPVRP